MMFDIHRLIWEAQSSEDGVRKATEARFLELCDADASQMFVEFAQVAADSTQQLPCRQFALLTLRKLATMYWSPGFESFRGTSTVTLESRHIVREILLKLCLDDRQVGKIRNGASYCVVQISAVDFPDQWPELLPVVYNAILNHSLAAMKLLNEIYDDVISEEMFFEEGIGFETLKIIFQVVSDGSSSLETQVPAFNLVHCCLLQMSTVDDSATLKRKEFTSQASKEILHVWSQFLFRNTVSSETQNLCARGKIYEGLTLLKNEFSRRIVSSEFSKEWKSQAMRDLDGGAQIYMEMLRENVDSSHLEVMNEYAVRVIEFLTAICDLEFTQQDLESVLNSLGKLCCLDNSSTGKWLADFNAFISQETGLLASYAVRDQAAEFLATLNSSCYSTILIFIVDELSQIQNFNEGWMFNESLLYLLQSILSNDSESPVPRDKLIGILSLLHGAFNHSEPCIFIYCRIILVAPKILEKFMETLPNVKNLVRDFLFLSLDYALSSANDLIKSASLIAFTYYAYFSELPSVLGPENCLQMQEKILRLMTEIFQGSEDDTDGVLLEMLDSVIDCNVDVTSAEEIRRTEFNFVFAISAKDPANIQVTVESQECLDKLLKNIDVGTYTTFWQVCSPPMLNVLSGSAQTNFEYSPLLSINLQFLTILMKRKPADENLSANICNNVFEPLQRILCSSRDEDILQLATEALGYLIYSTESTVIFPRLKPIITILDRLLSSDVPDQAALHSGSLTVTIFSKFSDELQNIIPMILEAAAARLLQATNISTIQNLLSIFCYVACADAQQTVNFLFSITIEGANGLALVVAKWLESFEVVRGEVRTKENIIALSKLYFLNDERMAAIEVNGDLIPYESDIIITRSMAKKMPDRYTQVSAYQKIIKLFISELEFQGKHCEPRLLMAGAGKSLESASANATEDNDDEDDWEDVDGPLDYEQLQQYAEENCDSQREELDEECLNRLSGNLDSRSVQQLLTDFFKEAASTDLSRFQHIYNGLSENEREILSHNLL